jgi:hypothetical protein
MAVELSLMVSNLFAKSLGSSVSSDFYFYFYIYIWGQIFLSFFKPQKLGENCGNLWKILLFVL